MMGSESPMIINLENEDDVNRLHNALFDNVNNDQEEDFRDQSDTDAEDCVEEREADSESEQSGFDTDYDENEESGIIYTAYQKKNKKVIDTFSWNTTPLKNRRKTAKQNLLLHLPGVIGEAKKAENISDTWLCLFDTSILETIVTWTNQFIEVVRSEYTRPRDARATDVVEIKAFIGLLYLAGTYRGSRLNLKDLWDSSGDGVETFRLTMSLNRFRFLMRCLRFDDRTTREERKKIDRITHVREVFEKFNENCKKSYSLGENVTIDEKLEAFRGRCAFRQYIPSKPAKYGIKIFALVDSKMWYTSNLEIYAGQQPDGPFSISNRSTDVVRRMVRPIVNTGRNLTTDNWFSDISLLKELADQRISYVATIKKNKWQIPVELKEISKRKERSSIFGFRKEGTIVSYVPKKNKNVILISSLHFDDNIDPCSGSQYKPEIVMFYNSTKGGIDTVDQLCATYNAARTTRRWPMVIFFSMLNIAGINTQVIYTGNGYKIENRRTFLRQLSKGLVMEAMVRRSNEKCLPRTLQLRLAEVTGQLHHAAANPLGDKGDHRISNQGVKRKWCEPCQEFKQRKNTKYMCTTCGKYLCLGHVVVLCNDCHRTGGQNNNEDSVEESC